LTGHTNIAFIVPLLIFGFIPVICIVFATFSYFVTRYFAAFYTFYNLQFAFVHIVICPLNCTHFPILLLLFILVYIYIYSFMPSGGLQFVRFIPHLQFSSFTRAGYVTGLLRYAGCPGPSYPTAACCWLLVTTLRCDTSLIYG